jgi:hypothetical protein
MQKTIMLCLLTSWGLLARAGSPTEFLTVGTYVPADMQFYAGGRATPERARLTHAYVDAFEHLYASGIVDDVLDLALSNAPRGEREEIRATVAKVLGILGTPRWNALFEHEAAFAFKIVMPIPEYLLVCKVAPGTGAARLAELKTLLQGLAEFAPATLAVADSAERGANVVALQVGGAPVGISIASRGDAIIVTTSPLLLSRVFDLMDAKDPGGSIVATPRFKEAFAKLPPAMDAQSFFDVENYVRTIMGFVSLAGMQAGKDPQAARAMAGATRMLEELALLKTVASVEYTKGDRMFTDTCLTMGLRDGPGYVEQLIAAQKPLTGYARVVPKDARSFWMTSGIDPLKIYDTVIEFIRGIGPDGERALNDWAALQERARCNVREDVLSWIDGGAGWICLPEGAPGAGLVAFMRVRNEEKARAFLERVREHAAGYIRSRGQQIDFVPVEGMDGLCEIRIAAVPFMRPVAGIIGSTLVVACSKEAVARVGATFSGKAPSILENPRFAALEVPDGHITEMSFYDTEKSLAPLANVLGLAGFGASLAPRNRDTRPLIKAGALLTKLAAFVRDVDLGLDYGSWTVYDKEAHTLVTRQMHNLTVPPPSPVIEKL